METIEEQVVVKRRAKKVTQLKVEQAKGVQVSLALDDKLFFQTRDGQVRIFQNDAISFLKTLPDDSIDLIATDPAYSGMNQMLKLGKGKIIGTYKEKGEEEGKWFEEFHDTEENYTAFLKECHRVLKKNRHIYLMFDSYSLLSLAPVVRKVFDVKNILCWDKANIGLGHYFRRRHEFILFASKGKRPLESKSIPDVWKIKRVTKAAYPTQKPTEVFEMMMKGSTVKGFTVCDPFLGSGSAMIASIKNGCNFIGCDIADKSVKSAKERAEAFLASGKDIMQPNSLQSDDPMTNKILNNG